MADAIDFLYNRPIGRTKAGEEIFADMQFLQALLAVRDRTGGTARNFIADALAAAAAAEITADGKITSVWQNDPPTVGGFSEGDLWFDTNDGNKCYQLRSGAWVNAQDSAIGTAIGAAAGAQATADTKIVTFYQTSAPTAGEVGDLWHDTDDAQRRTYRWSGSAWVHITDQTAFNTAAAISGQGAWATLATGTAFLLTPAANLFPYPSGDGGGGNASVLGWVNGLTGGGTFKCTDYSPRGGHEYYMEWAAGFSTGSYQVSYYDVPVNGEGSYSLSLHGNVYNVAAYIQIQLLDATRVTDLTTSSTTASLSASASRISCTATGSAGTSWARILIVQAPQTATGYAALSFRQIKFEPGSTPTAYGNDRLDAEIGADVTASNVASSITGQGALATYSAPTYAGNAAALTAGAVIGSTYIDSSDSNKLKTVVSAGAASGAYGYSENSTTGNVTSGTSWITVARVAFAGVFNTGRWALGALFDTQAGVTALSSGSVFNGNWRMVETSTGGGSGTTVKSGTFSCTDTGGGFFDFAIVIDKTTVAVVTSGARDVILQVQRASGSNDISGAFAAFLVGEFLPPG